MLSIEFPVFISFSWAHKIPSNEHELSAHEIRSRRGNRVFHLRSTRNGVDSSEISYEYPFFQDALASAVRCVIQWIQLVSSFLSSHLLIHTFISPYPIKSFTWQLKLPCGTNWRDPKKNMTNVISTPHSDRCNEANEIDQNWKEWIRVRMKWVRNYIKGKHQDWSARIKFTELMLHIHVVTKSSGKRISSFIYDVMGTSRRGRERYSNKK